MKKEAISNLTMRIMVSFILSWFMINTGGMLNICKSDGEHLCGVFSGGSVSNT